MEPGSPLRCLLVTLADRCSEWESQGETGRGGGWGGKGPSLETLPVSSSHPHPWKDSLTPSLPYLLFCLTNLRSLNSSGGSLFGSLEQTWEVKCSFSPGLHRSLEKQGTVWRQTWAPAQRRRLLSQSPTLFFH